MAVYKNGVYLLGDLDQEKPPAVRANECITSGPPLYIPGGWRNKPHELTREACENDRAFCMIGARAVEPARHMIFPGQVLAFRGISDNDLAMYWHMLVIPDLATTQQHRLRWVFDLTRQHIPLLMKMKARAMVFLAQNRAAFAARYGPGPIGRAMKNEVQCGFHIVPTVGYLHMHVLFGPLTVFGGSDESRGRWISLEEVMDILMVEETMEKYRYKTGAQTGWPLSLQGPPPPPVPPPVPPAPSASTGTSAPPVCAGPLLRRARTL